jgi:hypothetical protein
LEDGKEAAAGRWRGAPEEGGDAETVRITLFSVLNSLFFRLSSPTLLGRIWYVELGLNTLLVGFGLPRRAAED